MSSRADSVESASRWHGGWSNGGPATFCSWTHTAAAADFVANLDPLAGPGRRAAAVLALESLGARVETAAIDVAVEGPLERCLDERRARASRRSAG